MSRPTAAVRWLSMNGSGSSAYTASRQRVAGGDVVRLANRDAGATVSIAPGIGNLAYEFLVNGKNAFWFPYDSIGALAASPALCGNPFLAPWANRLDEHAFFAHDTKFPLNRDLGNYLRDPNDLPIHGLLLYSDRWHVDEVQADAAAAWVTSSLDFSRYPELMAQFPFAHSIEMTYRLSGTCLETRTAIRNDCAEAMPLSLGFHPYFQLHDSPRDAWTIRVAADSVWQLDDRFTPTGIKEPVAMRFPDARSMTLKGHFLDHVFGDLRRDADGLARFRLEGRRERLTVAYGQQFPVSVIYAPTGDGQSFVCFEPMTGITNAFNLAHRGVYGELPWIPAGGRWQEEYRIEVEGF